MAFRAATSRRAGAGILGTLVVLLAAALATGQPGPVLAATPARDAAPAASLAAGNESPAQPGSHRGCLLGSRLGRRHNSRLAGRGRPAYRRPLWHPGISENRQILAG